MRQKGIRLFFLLPYIIFIKNMIESPSNVFYFNEVNF